MFNKLFVAKECTTIALSVVFGKGIERLLITTTDLDPDGVTVRTASAVGGWMCANQIRSQSDAAVEWTFAKVDEIRENRKTKKEQSASQTETP
jgi:hypothetical protein